MSAPHQTSPLTTRVFDLAHPRSLGVYATYEEVQTVVDTLADHDFPVQSTMIVGTDLKLVERVTGRMTVGRAFTNGLVQGLLLGLFLGAMFMLLSSAPILTLLWTALMGAIFFGIFGALGHAATRGHRDFTSLTATIPLQYELMVEHNHAEQAREILRGAGGIPTPATPATPVASPHPVASGTEDTADGSGRVRPSYGLPAQEAPRPAEPGRREDGYGYSDDTTPPRLP
ncbi:hypothetical protein JSY14_04150 [Brachybacterium sp. EF45031]|uniref:general stress protein n=1 Tax=Brachybacterium sillae TaxID=2810536 RepID=UPI00217EFF21|nr:general stress protein [Brachybacterium sillae]MCS6711248.1 hypothetical protein [Brachybacterium sillae]